MKPKQMLEWLDEEIEEWHPDPISITVDANTRYHMLILIRDHIQTSANQIGRLRQRIINIESILDAAQNQLKVIFENMAKL